MKEEYAKYENYASAFQAFTQLCRNNNFKIGIQENIEALSTATSSLLINRIQFKYALKSIFCTSAEEAIAFERLFKQFWGGEGTFIKSKTTYKNQTNLSQNNNKSTLVMMGLGNGEDQTQKNSEAKNTYGASKREKLSKTDFAKVSHKDIDLLEELAMQLWHQMSLRLKRKFKKGKKGTVNLQQTIRSNISNGGNFLNLVKRQKKIKKYKLVVLLDVSGSMDKYSFFLLKFIYALRANFTQMEAFIFSTKLIRITEFLQHNQLQVSLNLLSQNAKNWSDGTKIGACLNAFNQQFAKQVLNGKTLTILLSDGLDTGEPAELQTELNKIKMRTKKLVWLNPLKGMEGYQPIQRGMKVALPSLHHFGSSQNINSLLQLENILYHA